MHPAGGQLLTVAARDEAGALAAIGCFFALDGALRFNGCVEETDYLDLIAPAGSAADAWAEVLSCLESVTSPAWTSLDPVSYTHLDVYKRQVNARGQHQRASSGPATAMTRSSALR